MKKIIEFIKNYGLYIAWFIFAVVVLATFVVPLFVMIGRDVWDLAINNPSYLRQ